MSAHTRPDGRCRYTLGAERCPAVGTVRVGDWWVCESHRFWAERPSDPERAEDGKMALEVEQFRARLASGAAAPPSAAREEALAAIRAALAIESRAEPWAWVRELVVREYRAQRALLEQRGVERQRAHEEALGAAGVAVARAVRG